MYLNLPQSVADAIVEDVSTNRTEFYLVGSQFSDDTREKPGLASDYDRPETVLLIPEYFATRNRPVQVRVNIFLLAGQYMIT